MLWMGPDQQESELWRGKKRNREETTGKRKKVEKNQGRGKRKC